MVAVITILLAFPLGFWLPSRLAARTAYAVAYLWAFTYQTLYLTLDSLKQSVDNPAFEPGGFPLSYGLVTLGIFLGGFGLVEVGHLVARRRSARRVPAPV